MTVQKSKEAAPKKTAPETKTVEIKTEVPATTESKQDAAPKKQGMGEGQKAVSKANWNDIFGKKKKR